MKAVDLLVPRCVAVALAAFAPAHAQRTWVVNSDGSGDFTDIPPAVAAASAGDTVYVSSAALGSYSSATISKGIALVADRFLNPYGIALDVRDIPPGEIFSLTDWGGDTQLSFVDCQGRIILDNVATLLSGLRYHLAHRTLIRNCADVAMTTCALTAVEVESSRVFLQRSGVYAKYVGTASQPLFPPLTMTESEVIFTNSWAVSSVGTPQLGNPTPVPGIEMSGGLLALVGDAGHVEGGAFCCSPPGVLLLSPAIRAQGGVILNDPRTVLNRFFPTAPGIVGTATVIPYTASFTSIRIQSSTQTVAPKVHAPPGTSAWILGSVSPAGSGFPTPFGTFWLDPFPGGAVLVGSGVTDRYGEFQVLTGLYSVMPKGTPTVWQGVVLNGGRIELSLPAWGVGRY